MFFPILHFTQQKKWIKLIPNSCALVLTWLIYEMGKKTFRKVKMLKAKWSVHMERTAPVCGGCWNLSALRQLLIFMAFTPSVATHRKQKCSSFVPENSKNYILANDSCSLLPPVFHMLQNVLILSLLSSIPLGSSYKLKPMNMFFNVQKHLF